jgi:hypothetical protein
MVKLNLLLTLQIDHLNSVIYNLCMLSKLIKFFGKYIGEFFGFLVTVAICWCCIVVFHVLLSAFFNTSIADVIAGGAGILALFRFMHILYKDYDVYM